MSETFVTSDLHFGHPASIRHSNRPFDDVDQMHEALIEGWNMTVGANDRVFVLGDFGFKGRHVDLEKAFSALRGEKHLVVGNHDEQNPTVLGLRWASREKLCTIRHNGKRLIACHYPLVSWKGMHQGRTHVHGHSHGSLIDKHPRRRDVGVDERSWEREFWGQPLNVDYVVATLEAGVFVPVDHHEESRHGD